MSEKLNEELNEFIDNIKKMENVANYDLTTLVRSYNHQIANLYYFYQVICKNKKQPDEIIIRHPIYKEHTLVYVNLGRGFPKELMDGHWCYILKIIGKAKALIIPTTSPKSEIETTNPFQCDIESICLETKRTIISRLKFSDMRTIDLQRIYSSKGVFVVKTDREYILEYCRKLVD